MSKLACICGHIIRDQTDFLPYKAYIREDEDTEKPVEIVAELLAQYCQALQEGTGPQFIKDHFLRKGDTWSATYYADRPLSEVLSSLILPLWNNYDRVIYECEACGRLWVELEDAGDGIRYAAYLPETQARHVLWSRHNHEPYGPFKG